MFQNVSKYTIKLRELRKNVLQSVNKTTYAIPQFPQYVPRAPSDSIAEITSLTYIVIILPETFKF